MNKELLRKILNQVEETPEQWLQSSWGLKTSCGTTFCIAGWACVLSGYEPIPPSNPSTRLIEYVQKEGEIFHIQDIAGRLLHLNDDQQEELFYETDEDDAYEILKEWAA